MTPAERRRNLVLEKIEHIEAKTLTPAEFRKEISAVVVAELPFIGLGAEALEIEAMEKRRAELQDMVTLRLRVAGHKKLAALRTEYGD